MNLLHVTLLGPGSSWWLLDIWNICTPPRYNLIYVDHLPTTSVTTMCSRTFMNYSFQHINIVIIFKVYLISSSNSLIQLLDLLLFLSLCKVWQRNLVVFKEHIYQQPLCSVKVSVWYRAASSGGWLVPIFS
jgi:hypothetical protein